MKKKSKNGPVNVGIPHGSMKPAAMLLAAIGSMAGALLALDRDALRKAFTSFVKAFQKKYPNSGRADVARQFDKAVPFKREQYRTHKTYMAVDNLWRTCSGLKTKASKGKGKRKPVNRKSQLVSNVQRAERCLMAIVNQLGIPPTVFALAAAKVGYVAADVERLFDTKQTKGTLIDVGMGQYTVAMRSGPQAGVPLAKALAKDTVKASIAALQPASKTATLPPAAPPAGKQATQTPSASVPKASRRNPAVTLKPADNLSRRPAAQV